MVSPYQVTNCFVLFFDSGDKCEWVSHDICLSPIPDRVLQEYGFSQDDFSGCYCPVDDGNCGWRAASVVLIDKEDRYYTIKESMRSVLENEQIFFKQNFGDQEYERLLTKLKQPEGPVSRAFWFDTIDCASLLAHVCRRPVVILAGVHSNTFLPFQDGHIMPNGQTIDAEPLVLHLNGCHFYTFLVKREAVNNIKWPPLYPTYRHIVAGHKLPTTWLDLYTDRCHPDVRYVIQKCVIKRLLADFYALYFIVIYQEDKPIFLINY